MPDALTWEDWSVVRAILVDGNESFTDDDILRRLAQRGFKIAKLREDDHEYVADLLKPGERLRVDAA